MFRAPSHHRHLASNDVLFHTASGGTLIATGPLDARSSSSSSRHRVPRWWPVGRSGARARRR